MYYTRIVVYYSTIWKMVFRFS